LVGKPSVIVVNSLVARGSVGGRASVFALERLGFPVVFVPTVVLSWHPGHGHAARIAPDSAGFAAILADLAGAPWLGSVGAVLTGYFGAADQVASAAGLVAALKAANPNALALCDPNIGDAGNLFQPEAVGAAIRDRLLPLADIATPNRFELSWLTNMAADPVSAARRLGPAEVLVTSADADAARQTIDTLVVTSGDRFRLTHRWLPHNTVHGTGDLFAALYLGHRLGGTIPAEAAARAAGAVLAMVDAADAGGLDEIPLAAGQDAILAPADGVRIGRMIDG
jgi:pyridoxine kinase